MLEVDNILEKCGDFSRQQRIMLVLCSLLNLLSAIHFLSNPIINYVPKYWCADGLDPGAPPPKESSCKPLYNNSTNSDTCNKYNYELHMGFQSFVSEKNWICDEGWKIRKGQAYFLAGRLISSLFMGYLADILGRVPILILTNVIATSGNFLTIFNMNVDLFCIFRFVCGFVINTNVTFIRILIVEYMRPSLRTVCLNICSGFFICLGMASTSWIVALIGNWRRFMLFDSLPIFVMPIFVIFVPESVQWLISRKKYDKAIASLKRVAKINGRQIDDSVFEEFIEDCKFSQQNTKKNPNLLHLLRMPRLRRIFLIMLLELTVILFYRELIKHHIRHLNISPFVRSSSLITSILPASLVVIILQDRIGRKALALTILLLIVLFILLPSVLLLHAANPSTPLLLTIYVFGSVFFQLAFLSNIQYTLELVPTCVRSQAMGAIFFIAYVLYICKGYILNLREVFVLLPEMILGVIAFMGACFCLLLPETMNRTLPCSLEDGEKLGNDEHWYTFGCTKKRTQPEELENSLAA
ncbi:organic anion transporter 3 isoform X1 [Drosophila virilis]|uniref:Uncharacterized protein, isoform B n=1 Tax=Drosophila virilis TaxID=7244 RepID=A0A0Q9W1L1_DROVI|nr:solute carrier family 22 member 8 isoform X3 [Drosophila virilis]KRF78726.1 uncharacterized protein Dvir_GJ10440, isoform B [Drosophila virilis]